jgi:hypothetical protein
MASPRARNLLALPLALALGCITDDASPTTWRDDDFSGFDAEPWLVLHPELAAATVVDGALRLRPAPYTAWYGGSEAYHQYVLVSGDFAITSHVEVGDLQGGPAQPDWRLGGVLVRDPGPGAVDAYHAAFGTVAAGMSAGMVAEYKSTVGGYSVLDFQPHPSGSGELRICRVGSVVRSMFRADGATGWTLLDQRQRPDLPATLAAGPMVYAYAPTGDFEAAFDFIDFDPLTNMAECEIDLPEPSEDTDSSGETSTGGETSTDGETSTGSTTDEPADPSTGESEAETSPTDVPLPTAACPPIVDGTVTLCPAALGGACRNVRVLNTAGATGSGPLQVHWHGTYESPEALLSWDVAALQILAMTIAQGGVLVLPYADPAAVARSGPFPWWVVGNAADPQMHTDRQDDFVLFDEAVACILDAGLASPERINTSGMSAGGIMTSHLVERRGYLASAVSWSGGLPVAYQPAQPLGSTAVMVLHGGPTDLYCGPGVTGGGCYGFRAPSETLAADVVAAGNWAFLCDHRAGHSSAMGGQGAQFMSLAVLGSHPWTGYPFGSGGNWMLDHYCYDAGEPSPWD